MSLTSCFKYAIELPEATLTRLLRAIISQGETAGIPLTYEVDGVVVGTYTARVSASLVDSDAEPSSLDLLASDLKATLHLHMEIDVTVHGVDGLDPITYDVGFELPATIVKDASVSPPQLKLDFSSVTPADLHIVLSGGQLVYSAALFEPAIHQTYSDHPELHSFTEVVSFPFIGNVNANVLVFDDDPGATPFRGRITVEIPSPGILKIDFPGNLVIESLGVQIENRDFVASIHVPVSLVPPGDPNELVVQLSVVSTSDVTIVFATPAPLPYGVADPILISMMQQKIVALLHTFQDPSQPVPTQAEVRSRIEDALIAYATGTSFPLFPLGGGPGDIDLATTVPATIDASVLVLQIEQESGVPCDGAVDFTNGAGVAIGMGAREVQRRMDQVADSLDGRHITVEGYDVELARPTVSLADPGEHGETEGHIWVEGTAVVHVGGCIGDVDADYHGALMLDAVNNSDGTIGFTVRPGTFGGDADKGKKNHFDPDEVAAFLATWDFDLPTIPAQFAGVGRFTLNISDVLISRAGIVLTGNVTIELLSMMMYKRVFSTTQYWALERTGG